METLIGRMLCAVDDLDVYKVYQSPIQEFKGIGILTKSSVVGEGFIILLPYLCSKVSAKDMNKFLAWYDVESKPGLCARKFDDVGIEWLNVWTLKDFVDKISRDFNFELLMDRYDAEEARLSMNGDSSHDPSVTKRQLDMELDMYMAGML